MRHLIAAVLAAFSFFASAQVVQTPGSPASAPSGPGEVLLPHKIDEPPTQPCDEDHNTDTIVQPLFEKQTDQCTGTSCDGKTIPVAFTNYVRTGQQIWKCKNVSGPNTKPVYQWVSLCEKTEDITTSCVVTPKVCPKCKPSDPARYWADPVVVVDPPLGWDTCADIVAKNPAIARLVKASKAMTDKMLATINAEQKKAYNAAYGTSVGFPRPAAAFGATDVAPVCSDPAKPVLTPTVPQ